MAINRHRILITGGTGSVGSNLVRMLVAENVGHEIIVFSRDEQKQFKMRMDYEGNFGTVDCGEIVKFCIGDIKDRASIARAFSIYKPDIVIHAAAHKHVRVCDENPEQATSVNILGTLNVLEEALSHNVKVVCVVSTDKACMPTTLYGMTKNIAEKMANNMAMRQSDTKIVGIRCGNVINSSWSLIPLYQSISKLPVKNRIYNVSNMAMTRFFITLDEVAKLIGYAIGDVYDNILDCSGIRIKTIDGIFYIPEMRSARIIDIAELYVEKYGGIISIRTPYPTEKFREYACIGYSSDTELMWKSDVKIFLESQGLL